MNEGNTMVSVHNVEHHHNRSNITFNVQAYGNDFVKVCNGITAICQKHNAQDNRYTNRAHLLYDNKGNVIGHTHGNAGGTITFHSNSCDPKAAAQELLDYFDKITQLIMF